MHIWGDEWFEKHGGELDVAIGEIQRGLRRHGIGVYIKEKYGCAREELLRFWDGGLYQIIFGYRLHIGTFGRKGLYRIKWFKNLCDSLHRFIYFKLDRAVVDTTGLDLAASVEKDKRKIWKGLCYYNKRIGLVGFVQRHQAKMYNKVYQNVLKKHPDIIDELVSEIDGYEMIEPCKWGGVDGKSIHAKYWKKIK